MALQTPVDTTVSVAISPDKCQAYLTFAAPEAGQQITLKMIIQAITKSGVSLSLVEKEIVNKCFAQQSAKHVCIAQARLPTQGQDAAFIPLVESETTKAPGKEKQEEDAHQFVVVEAGTPLLKRVPATQGEPGFDLTGNVLNPVNGIDTGFAPKLNGVEPSPENPNVLVSAVKGHPVFLEHGVYVDPTLHVDNVDAKSGNITFDGSLEVKGDVAAGMTIDVTGDVFIQGGVDRASIKAGHNIKVGCGIYGDEKPDRLDEVAAEYKIIAGSDIEATFVQQSTVSAGNNIAVKEYICHSHVRSGNQLLLGQNGGKGIVLGGRSEALHGMVVKQLGNEKDVPTKVTVGELSGLYKVYHNLEKELAARNNEANQLEEILEKHQQGGPVLFGKISLDKSQKIRETLVAVQKKMTRAQELLQALEPEIALQKKAMIQVTHKIYPNAAMTINETTKQFSEQTIGDIWVPRGGELVRKK